MPFENSVSRARIENRKTEEHQNRKTENRKIQNRKAEKRKHEKENPAGKMGGGRKKVISFFAETAWLRSCRFLFVAVAVIVGIRALGFLIAKMVVHLSLHQLFDGAA